MTNGVATVSHETITPILTRQAEHAKLSFLEKSLGKTFLFIKLICLVNL